MGKNRAFTGIEQGVVLHFHHGRLYGVQAASTAFQYGIAFLQGGGKAFPVGFFHLRVHVFTGNGTRSAMNGNGGFPLAPGAW
ncbi:hypothetical protein FQZ97_987130 [compost metagenome]